MAKKIQDVLDGCTGFFNPVWKPNDLAMESERGYLKLTTTGHLKIETLEEEPHRKFIQSHESRIPQWIAAQTIHAGALITDLMGSGSSYNIGGTRASANRYRASTLIFGIDAKELRSPKVTRVSYYFPEIMGWARMTGTSEDRSLGEDNRIKELTIKLAATPTESANIKGGRSQLHVSGDLGEFPQS